MLTFGFKMNYRNQIWNETTTMLSMIKSGFEFWLEKHLTFEMIHSGHPKLKKGLPLTTQRHKSQHHLLRSAKSIYFFDSFWDTQTSNQTSCGVFVSIFSIYFESPKPQAHSHRQSYRGLPNHFVKGCNHILPPEINISHEISSLNYQYSR